MNITLAQVRFKLGDFNFNYKSVEDAVNKSNSDIIVLPAADLESLGGRDIVLDEKIRMAQNNFYEKVAADFPQKHIFLGDIHMYGGHIDMSEFGLYEINGQTIYVSDSFEEEVECDLYILAHNRYYAMNTYREFVESINTNKNLVYINAVAMADSNIYDGASFVKNANNIMVYQAPQCAVDITEQNFTNTTEFIDTSQEEEIFKVITFALKEYCENTGLKKVILGLSGGIDSALTAALAVNSIGAENVFGVLMPSMFSSEGSVVDAEALAANLGIQTVKEPITNLFEAFMNGRERKNDLAEENLQARLRALILMFYSNRENMLLLSTGNKSEAAMGFGTLYGDLSGGLNLICDLTKQNVYKLANYINRNGEIIPQNTIDKAPSAELHPGQKDSDRLPEYAVLDDIIEMYLEQNIPVEEIYAKYDTQTVDEVIRKIHRFQFKRKQCCLGIRLTERSFAGGIDLPVVQKFY